MAKTKTKIEKQLKKKSDSELTEIIILSKKHPAWIRVAEVLSGPRRWTPSFNLSEINESAKDGEVVVIPGKVLSLGDIDKKIKIVAKKFSEKAREKLLKGNVEISMIVEEIKKNPEGKGIRVL
ncbi:MAG: 50S ribosomal protein L18e [Nanoarchaeota archaeon]|nr:50S ribosomal protein L18e [Nanoarchaeota archaeon]